jgi:hypothetical protein
LLDHCNILWLKNKKHRANPYFCIKTESIVLMSEFIYPANAFLSTIKYICPPTVFLRKGIHHAPAALRHDFTKQDRRTDDGCSARFGNASLTERFGTIDLPEQADQHYRHLPTRWWYRHFGAFDW